MGINRTFFFDHLNQSLYPRGLHAAQIAGHDAILDAWENTSAGQDDRWLAYMLATACHETAHTMQPVRETLATSDVQASQRLETAWEEHKLPWVKQPYWRPDAEGKAWFGRGLVQLTHRDNYVRMRDLIHVDLVTDPGLALDMDVAIKVMFVGMETGAFSGKKLSDVFAGDKEDWFNARRIINGTESAALVAGYAKDYYRALSYTT